jgi:tetratricopeptide (TPR) repeat protein
MKKINLFFAILSIVLLSSCEGFLDVKPTNSADAATSITTAADAKVIINGLMSKMVSSNYYGRNFFLYGDAKGGDFAIRSQGRGNDALYVFNHSATSNSYSGYWSQMYHCLLQINNLLANIEKIEAAGKGSTTLSDYKGQALTARALVYFDLVRLYGKPYNMDKNALGVPLVLTPLDASAQPTRATVAQIYDQIVADLTAAAPLMGKTKTLGYLNYYANKAIQARVYLYMENYSAALTAAQEIITSGKYSLYSNANWVSSWSTENGSESIFELGVYLSEADLGTSSLGYYLLRTGTVKGAMGWFMASDSFLARLNQDPSDVRWGIMDYDETYSETGVKRYGSCRKYTGVDLKGDKGSTSAVNIKVIRLSEIYLIAAEAAFPTNKELAASYLKEIRKRSPNLPAPTATTITMQMIKDERSKELFCEGQRFFDMIRWNESITFNDDFISPAVVITHRPKTIDRTFYKTILPIPQAEIDANPAIKSQQNPGYND